MTKLNQLKITTIQNRKTNLVEGFGEIQVDIDNFIWLQ